MGSADVMMRTNRVVELATALARQATRLMTDAEALYQWARALPDVAQELRIGPRQTVDCERIDAPIDRIEGALGAGCLVLALVGMEGHPKTAWRTVQVQSASGNDGQMMVQEMYNDTVYQLTDAKHQVVRVVIFPNGGGV